MDNQVIVSDYSQMDRVLRDERQYILNIVKQVKKAGCNVLLIQKSILRYSSSCTLTDGPVSLYLELNISKTTGDRDSVPKDHQ